MEDIISSIALCQKKLEKYAANDDEAKLIYYLSKLKHLPIKVSHLEQTGVGRSVNALRHINGSVGDRARNLVGVWKKMVTAEEGSGGREQHDRGDKRSSGAAVATARASPKPSKQQPPTSQSPEDGEDDEDCERLQIEEAVDAGLEDVGALPSPERLDPNCYDPSQPSTEFNRLSTNGNKYLPKGSAYGRAGTASDTDHDSPSYDPYTSTQDYQSAGVSNEPLEYQPTPVVSPDGQEDEEERAGSTANSVEDGAVEELLESANSSQDNKSKNKHKDRKKHKSRDKDKSSKDKHRHKSSDKNKEKSHKDKRKDKDRSPSKKTKHDSVQVEVTNKDGLDRRRYKSHKSDDIDYNPRSPVENSLMNGHDALPDIVAANENSVASSSKYKSSSKHSSSKSSSSHSKESKKDDKEKKDKKDKKRTRENGSDHQSKNDHKTKKRKSDDQEGFGAALMGLDEESPSKQKKSMSHSKEKDDKSHRSKSSGSSKSSPSKNRTSSSHSSRPACDKQGSSSGKQATVAVNSPPVPHPELDIISPNYKPLPRVPLPESLSLDDLETYPSFLPSFVPEAPLLTQQQTLDQMMTSKGKSKRQIYSGKARSTCLTAVPSLFDLSVRCLQENIDALEFTGGIPYDLLKPVFERASATQLFNLENYNPYLLEDTRLLWEQHCKKDFKGKIPDEMETYRDMYMRLIDERSQKLKSLTENLQNKFVTKPPPRRTTQLAFVGTVAKPPKNVARAQAKYGTGVPIGTPARTTKAAEILARKQAMQNVQRVERTAGGGGASNGPAARSSASAKKPRAPLMAKTMQFYKKTFRR